MDAFSYLSVLISIILGLGITQLLTGVGRLVNARARVRWYWPVLVWAALLLLLHVQTWWTMFGLRTHGGWTFVAFLVVLLQPILLYLVVALLLPETAAAGTIDLRQSYYEHVRWLFGLLMALVVASLIRPIALGDGRPLDLDFATHVVFFSLGAIGVATRSRWFHELIPLVNLLLIATYIGVLFARLR